MPIDYRLGPSLPNPQLRQIERTVDLEQRVRALESKRDLVVTPFLVTNGGGPALVPYYGGRLWMTVNGRASCAPTSTGYKRLGGTLNLNGQPVFSDYATVCVGSTADFQQVGLPGLSAEFLVSALTSVYGATPGSPITLTADVTNSATNCRLSGHFLEWSQP